MNSQILFDNLLFNKQHQILPDDPVSVIVCLGMVHIDSQKFYLDNFSEPEQYV